ncbi:hypothetical protein PVAP13_2NG166403 [Panicum virgatum]|uniref:Uncharacterized protein n=1 Tax=Panicum virgatum TaxID=38727 RepID=A0A8T0VC85_PANVG|nr:hypothetical protein PVAP13_2NG166403 [Panicum virgatum]
MVSTEENRSSSGRHGLAACTCGWMESLPTPLGLVRAVRARRGCAPRGPPCARWARPAAEVGGPLGSRRRAVGRGTAPAAHRAEAVVERRRVAHGRRSRARGRAQATWDLADRGRGHVKAAPSCEIVGRRMRVEGHRGRASRSRVDRPRSRRRVA